MKPLFLFFLAVCLCSSVACTKENNSTQAARESTLTNSDLEKQVKAKIDSDPALQAADLSVSADADHNTATLSGKVESEELRTRAVEMARAANPGLIVEDKIDVKPRELTRAEYTEEHAAKEREAAKAHHETVGNSLDDAWIHTKIVTKLIGDSDTPERKINVDVSNNVVTLRGTVDTVEAKTEAERIAKETEGVKRVINQLKIQTRPS